MTNTRSLRGILAATVVAFTLSACGSSTPEDVYIPAGPETYCVGPEQGLFADPADVVRYPDEACTAGALPAGFAIVSAPSWGDVPDVGEVVFVDSTWGYRRAHTYGRHRTVVVVVNAPTPPPVSSRVLITRDPTVGSPTARSQAATRSAAARKVASASPEAVAPAARPANPNIQRGGLGVGASDKTSSGAVRRSDSSLNKSSTSGGSKSSSSSSSSGSRSSKSGK